MRWAQKESSLCQIPGAALEGGSCPEGREPYCWPINGWGPPPEWAGLEYLCAGSSWRLGIPWKRWQWEAAIHLLTAAGKETFGTTNNIPRRPVALPLPRIQPRREAGWDSMLDQKPNSRSSLLGGRPWGLQWELRFRKVERSD